MSKQEVKHTPGPWSVGETKPDGDPRLQCFRVTVYHGEGSNHGNAVAEAFSASRTGRENAEANARLIAAAPKLLFALQEAVRTGKVGWLQEQALSQPTHGGEK